MAAASTLPEVGREPEVETENPFIVRGALVFPAADADEEDERALAPNQENFQVLLAQISALIDKTPGDRVINALIQALYTQLNSKGMPWGDLSVEEQSTFLGALQEHLSGLLENGVPRDQFRSQVGGFIRSAVSAGQQVAFDASGAEVGVKTLQAVVAAEMSKRQRICGVSKPCCGLTLQVAVGLLAAAGLGVAIWRIVSGFQGESAGAEAATDAGEAVAQFGPGAISAVLAGAYACRRAAVVSGQRAAAILSADTEGVRATQDRRGRLRCGLAIAGLALIVAAAGVVVCELFDKQTDPGTAAHTGFSSGAAVSLMLGLVALPWVLAASGLLCVSAKPNLPPRPLDFGRVVEMGGRRSADLTDRLLGAVEGGRGIDETLTGGVPAASSSSTVLFDVAGAAPVPAPAPAP